MSSRPLLLELATTARNLRIEHAKLSAAQDAAEEALYQGKRRWEPQPAAERRALEVAVDVASKAASDVFQAYLDARDLMREACEEDLLIALLDAVTEKPPSLR